MDVCLCVCLFTYRRAGPNGLKFGMGAGMDHGTVCGLVWTDPTPLVGVVGKTQKCHFQAKSYTLKNDRRPPMI